VPTGAPRTVKGPPAIEGKPIRRRIEQKAPKSGAFILAETVYTVYTVSLSFHGKQFRMPCVLPVSTAAPEIRRQPMHAGSVSP
jgi:hypothetical protein